VHYSASLIATTPLVSTGLLPLLPHVVVVVVSETVVPLIIFGNLSRELAIEPPSVKGALATRGAAKYPSPTAGLLIEPPITDRALSCELGHLIS